MKKLALALLLLAAPAFAGSALFPKYEAVRQAFLKGTLADVQKSATQLATEARKHKQLEVAKHADAVAKSADVAQARESFSAVSEEMIKLRKDVTGEKPAVYHCPMVKKSWLQAKGKVGNPYDTSMELCGILKEE